MYSLSKVIRAKILPFIYFSFLLVIGGVSAQETSISHIKRDTLLSVAREYMQAVRFCALITVDSAGQPHARAMDPFLPDENMVVWLGTNRNSRKVSEIRNNPQVSLYYADDKGEGYVTILGTASLIDDPEQKAALWKDEWEEYYRDEKKTYLLIRVIPHKLEILNYKHGIIGDEESWETPFVEFNPDNN